ncbi:hypothetical protein BSK33_17735 [Geobacillus sp. 44B]|nr:hypothetical protein BSK33_17735 [Geobacillus sp. 44B]
MERNKEEKKMNKLFERKESAIHRNVLYGEISEWLRILPVHLKLCELLLDEVDREEAFFANQNEISEYLMER